MQHYSLSAEISGLEVRVLPGSPSSMRPCHGKISGNHHGGSVAPTRNDRNPVIPPTGSAVETATDLNCRADCTVCANCNERMVCNAAKAQDLEISYSLRLPHAPATFFSIKSF